MAISPKALATLVNLLTRAPSDFFRALGTPFAPRSDRGDALDPIAHIFCRLDGVVSQPISPDTVQAHRARMDTMIPHLDGRGPDLPKVETLQLPGPGGDINARLYYPRSGGAPLPVLLYLHGGGWVIGSTHAYDALCRRLAKGSGCAVLSIDYRLAPEHPYPAPIEDCEAAYRYLLKEGAALGLDKEAIAVGGDSAGGNLSALLCQRLRDAGMPLPRLQVLIYPSTDLRCDTPSHRHFAKGFFLTNHSIEFYQGAYCPDPALRGDPKVSPLLADLSGLPEALVITAGFDPLRDDGEAYAQALREAGVSTAHRGFPRMIHGFASFSALMPQGLQVSEEIAAALRGALYAP